MKKKRILYINGVSGFSSPGKITADLSRSKEYDSLVCYGRKKDYENINSYKFTTFFENCVGALRTILFDNNLSICSAATKRLIRKIKEFEPDIIHLQVLHGYYLNVEMLFKFLKEYNKPVVWTMHDCWSFTGYCPHFDYANCNQYKTKCTKCPYDFSYPFSLFKQNVEKEFEVKKKLFNSLDNLTIVVPSKWLETKIKESFLSNCKVVVINNGIDYLDKDYKKNEKFNIIAVASYWTKEKGKDELKKIIPLIDDDINITIVGDLKDNDQIFNRCKLVGRLLNRDDLMKEYSEAHVFMNLTLQDNFPTVNIESLSCGTPVVTYNTGGSAEVINDDTGIIIDKYGYETFAKTINDLKNNYYFDSNKIKEYAKKYSKETMLDKYNDLYNKII